MLKSETKRMPSSQLKRAEKAIVAMRDQGELPPETADAIEELVDALRTLERRLATLEGAGHKPPTKQMNSPNRNAEAGKKPED
jgi:uncharacterized membrane protein YccC